jgi:hypothetical protein
MSPVIHREDDAGILGSHPTASRFTKERQLTRLEKAEQSAVKKAILAKYRPGERVANPMTGAIAVVDASAPTGLRPLWKATNAHNHLGSVRLGDGHPVTKGKAYDGKPYGKLAGTDEDLKKQREGRPANPNSRL